MQMVCGVLLYLCLKVVQNLVEHWQPEGLASVVHTVCTFLKDVSFQSTVRESQHGNSNSSDDDDDDSESRVTISDKVHIPGATYLTVSFDPRSVRLLVVAVRTNFNKLSIGV